MACDGAAFPKSKGQSMVLAVCRWFFQIEEQNGQEKEEKDLSNGRKILVLCVLYIIRGEMFIC